MGVARVHAWWVVPSLAVSLLVGWWLGAPGWMAAYGVINVRGVLTNSLESGAGASPATRAMQALAIVQIPTGFPGLGRDLVVGHADQRKAMGSLGHRSGPATP